MPTYAFRCPTGHDFDRFYKTMSNSPMELPCPECGAIAARQMSGGAGLMFKGSGFYLTDYGKNAHRGESKPSTGGDAASAKPDSGSAESPKPKTESSKAESSKPKAESPKSESAKPKAESAAPKSSKPKSE
jgi:putative FmdB family regulatory protein